jgi:hypothetical protein
MRRFLALPLSLAGAVVALSLLVAPAHAQASRTWVSGVGDDVNPCSRTAPCKTFAGAISKTAVNGEINCIDPGGFGAVTITKSITIDCHEVFGSVLNAGTGGINVAFDSFAATDVRKTVNIRNIMIQGFDSGTTGIRLFGVGSGSQVNIEDCIVNGDFSSTATGINDQRTNGAMSINNTTVRNMGASGIAVSSAGSGSLLATITNTRVINSNNGIVAGSNSAIIVNHSQVSANAGAGLVIGAAGKMIVNSALITLNGTGFQATGSLRMSNSDIAFNSTGFTGTLNSFTNNRFSNNGTLGTITPIGSTSNPTGQQ